MYPCLRKVKCGYEDCGKEIVYKNLKKHTQIKHNSSVIIPVPLKNITFGDGGRLKRAGQGAAASSLAANSAPRQQLRPLPPHQQQQQNQKQPLSLIQEEQPPPHPSLPTTPQHQAPPPQQSLHTAPQSPPPPPPQQQPPLPTTPQHPPPQQSLQTAPQPPSQQPLPTTPQQQSLQTAPQHQPLPPPQQQLPTTTPQHPSPQQEPEDAAATRSSDIDFALTPDAEQIHVDSAASQRHEQREEQGLREAVDRNTAAIQGVNQKIDQILQHLQSSNPPRTTQSRTQTLDQENVAVLFRSARSIRTLQTAAGEQLISCPARNQLFCSICVTDPENAPKKATGNFEYDYKYGQQFPPGQKLHQKFKGLKTTVLAHFTSSKHKTAEAKVNAERDKQQRADAGYSAVAERVLQAAYHVIKQSGSHKSFERLMVMLSKSGVDIGDKNHSSGMMVKARDAFHTVILDKIASAIKDEPCVAVMADKVTLYKRTVDITAVNLVMPDAPPEDMLQSFVIAAPVVQDHTGEGLARELKSSLSRVGVTQPTQVSAFGGDGQYHHLGVPMKLAGALHEDGGEAFTMPSVWDPSHLMHLGEQGARNSAPCAWVDETINTMNIISQRFRHGAGFEPLLGADVSGKPKTLKSWSDTRFAAHAAAVFSSFLDNVEAMRDALRKRREQSGQVPEDLKLASRLLRDRKFLACVAALCDIYAVLGRGSREQQNTNKLPWEISAAFGGTLLNLDAMVTTLDSCTVQSESAVQKAIRLANLEEQWPRAVAYQAELLEQVRPVREFVATLLNKLRDRRLGTTARASTLADNALLLKQMPNVRGVADLERLSRCQRTLPDQVGEVLSAMRALVHAGIIPSSSAASESSVLETLSLLRSDGGQSPDNKHLLKLLWNHRLQKPLLKSYIDLVKRLWLVLPLESVVESMSSVLKEVFGTHRMLKHENAAKELVVRWNGPDEAACEPFLRAVQQECEFEFRRSAPSRKHRLGAMLRNHRAKRGKWNPFHGPE